MAETIMQFSVDDELEAKAAVICDELGIDLSAALRMFMKRMVLTNGIPFSMTLPKKDYKSSRAVRAMYQLSEEAQRNGTANMTLDEINEEIAAARRERAEREAEG